VRIIIGTTTKVANAGGGAFFCPSCRHEANYARVRASRYFTFFFIPLFPIRTIGEYLKCGTCQAELRPEVLTLSREQIAQATAPWTCSACGNHNSYAEVACISCGAARKQAPPPMPGQPAAGPVVAILSPPQVAGMAAPRKGGLIATILLVLGGCFVLFIALSIFALIWGVFHPRHHSQPEPEKPGQSEFKAASESISNNDDGAAHGNSPQAQKLAAALSEGLAEAHKKIPAVTKPDMADRTGGRFLVFCQLNEDACVFLVHVPNLRHFDVDTQESITKICFLEACAVVGASQVKGTQHVAVATRGALLYNAGYLVAYPAQGRAALQSAEKLTTEAWSVPGLYPFFAARPAIENENVGAPAGPTTPETSAKPENPPVSPKSEPPPVTMPKTPAAPAKPETRSPPSKPDAAAAPTAVETPPPPRPTAISEAPAAAENRRPGLDSRSPPSWVPMYPELLKPAFGTRTQNNGVIKGMATCETADPLQEVKEFYENRLKADGYEITTDKSKAGIFEHAQIAGKKEDGKQTLRVAIHQMKTKTIAVLTYEGAADAEATPEKPR
jgi:hypothetical protein